MKVPVVLLAFAFVTLLPAASSTCYLDSTAFDDNDKIPSTYTCEGDDKSPPLNWDCAPDGTKSYVLIADDPDAPDPARPTVTFVHWVVYNIPVDTTSLIEDASSSSSKFMEGENDFGDVGYGGPCPPVGEHRYYFKLYALNVMLRMDEPTKEDIEEAMQGHILDRTDLMGKYEKNEDASR